MWSDGRRRGGDVGVDVARRSYDSGCRWVVEETVTHVYVYLEWRRGDVRVWDGTDRTSTLV